LAAIISNVGLPMPPPPGSSIGYTATIRMVPSVLAIAVLTGALAAVIAAVLPARRASRLMVVDALRHNI
ncbi:MAG TPA: ABC transporter permease, partial [Nitrosospira sp.]|nr:ABC transporter permease [Nitrosospira sp.]